MPQLHRTVKVGETIYLQRGEEVIAIHVEEFTQGAHAKRAGELIKARLIVDAPLSWSIEHVTNQGINQRTGKSNAKHQRNSQEKEKQSLTPLGQKVPNPQALLEAGIRP